MKTIEQYNEDERQTALQKSKDKVIAAINDAPMGLTISQIMSICKISVKTAKNILAVIDVKNQDGVYTTKKLHRLERVLDMAAPKKNLLEELKSQVITTTVIRKEVALSKEQLCELLCDLFDLSNIEFYDDGSVLLSEVGKA